MIGPGYEQKTPSWPLSLMSHNKLWPQIASSSLDYKRRARPKRLEIQALSNKTLAAKIPTFNSQQHETRTESMGKNLRNKSGLDRPLASLSRLEKRIFLRSFSKNRILTEGSRNTWRKKTTRCWKNCTNHLNP